MHRISPRTSINIVKFKHFIFIAIHIDESKYYYNLFVIAENIFAESLDFLISMVLRVLFLFFRLIVALNRRYQLSFCFTFKPSTVLYYNT